MLCNRILHFLERLAQLGVRSTEDRKVERSNRSSPISLLHASSNVSVQTILVTFFLFFQKSTERAVTDDTKSHRVLLDRRKDELSTNLPSEMSFQSRQRTSEGETCATPFPGASVTTLRADAFGNGAAYQALHVVVVVVTGQTLVGGHRGALFARLKIKKRSQSHTRSTERLWTLANFSDPQVARA